MSLESYGSINIRQLHPAAQIFLPTRRFIRGRYTSTTHPSGAFYSQSESRILNELLLIKVKIQFIITTKLSSQMQESKGRQEQCADVGFRESTGRGVHPQLRPIQTLREAENESWLIENEIQL